MNTPEQAKSMDEEILVRKAGSSDLDAFNELVLAYQDVAYYHAYWLLQDPALADDATQDSFLRAFQHITEFRGGSFRAWILKIVTNAAYDMLRRSKRHPTQSLYPEDEYAGEVESPVWLADSTSAETTVEQSEFSKDLYQTIDELPAGYRALLTLVDLHELEYAEAAEVLKIPIGTLKSRLARARLKMSEKLRSVENRQYCLYEPA